MDPSKGEPRFRDAAAESGRRGAQRLEFGDEAQGQGEAVGGRAVGQVLLGLAPHALVGVELGRVAGQPLQVESTP